MAMMRFSAWLVGEHFKASQFVKDASFPFAVNSYGDPGKIDIYSDGDPFDYGYVLIEHLDPTSWENFDKFLLHLYRNRRLILESRIDNLRIITEEYFDGTNTLGLSVREIKMLAAINAEISFLFGQRCTTSSHNKRRDDILITITLSGRHFKPVSHPLVLDFLQIDEASDSLKDEEIDNDNDNLHGKAYIEFGERYITWTQFSRTLETLSKNINYIRENHVEDIDIFISYMDSTPCLCKFNRDEIQWLNTLDCVIGIDIYAS